MPDDRRLLVLGIAGADRDLGAQAALALAHPLGDVRRERLRHERLADHDVSIASFTISSKRDMWTPACCGIQVHVALERGVVELLVAVGLDPQDLLDAGDSDAREAHACAGHARLHVGSVDV